MRRVRGRRGDPVAHRTRLVDSFLQHLPALVFLVEHELVGILRRVLLAELVPDAELAKHAFHAEGARFVGNDGHHPPADRLVADQGVQDLHERHRGRDLAVVGALEEPLERGEIGHCQRFRRAPARGQVAAEAHAPLAHVFELLRAFRKGEVGHLLELIVGYWQRKAIAHVADRLHRHLLLLMGDVLRFARHAHAVALDGLGQDDRRLALVMGCRVVGGIDLVRIEAAAIEPPDVVIRPVGHHGLQLRRVEKVLADVRAILALERLVFAVDAFHHPAHEDACLVAREEGVPARAPHHLDDVPARATEFAFELLDDLAIAAHRAVEALQVAVDDKDEIVELLAPGHADGAHGFGLVHLAVAHERPDLAAFGVRELAIVEIFHEPRLVDRHQRAQAHRHRGKLPEVRHQPWVRIR